MVEVPSHVQRMFKRDVVAVSHVRLDEPRSELTHSIRLDDAFLVTVHLEDLVAHELWLDGRLATTGPLRSGAVYLYELDRDPRARVFQAAETVHFFLPRSCLDRFAADHGIPRVSGLKCAPGIGVDDPVLAHLSRAIVPLLRAPRPGTGLVIDQILNAVCARLLSDHGQADRLPPRNGLAPWQERRAKEMMDTNLDASLAELAAACRVSVTHFLRGFRQSTGISPHQWLLQRRVDKAKSMLADTDVPILEIALSCGFSSQSHFNRAFATRVGAPPGRWRRER